jgi:AAT family amino acid transporter/GABA permease
MVFIYILIALAQIHLRRERERRGDAPPALLMWLFPWASYAAVAGFTAVVVAMALTPGQQQDLYFSLVTLIVVFLAYAILRRRRIGQPATVLP